MDYSNTAGHWEEESHDIDSSNGSHFLWTAFLCLGRCVSVLATAHVVC